MNINYAATLEVVGDPEQIDAVRSYLTRKIGARVGRVPMCIETEADEPRYLRLTEDCSYGVPELVAIGLSDDFPAQGLARRVAHSSEVESFAKCVFIEGEQVYVERGEGFEDEDRYLEYAEGRPHAWRYALLQYNPE